MDSIKMSDLIPNEHNPRGITDDELERLKESIKTFTKGMKVNRIKIDQNNVILAGHKRFQALQALGYEEIPKEWVEVIDFLTEEEKKEFMIRDNVSNGHWLMDVLKEDEFWADLPIEDWVDEHARLMLDNEDIDIEAFFDDAEEQPKEDTFKITLEFTEDDFREVNDAFEKITGTKEKIIYDLLVPSK